MALSIEHEVEDSVRILRLVGELDNRAAMDLQAELLKCLGEKTQFLLLDVKNLESVSGAGLRVLVMVNERLAAEGGALVLTGLRPLVREVFEIGGMVQRFAFEASRAAGLSLLRRRAKVTKTVDLAGEILRKKGDRRIQRGSPMRPARAAKRSSLAVDLLKGGSDENEG
jgi:anti-anti-sigma factor